MALRNEWEFEYSAGQLLEAANEQLMFRNERITIWEQKKAEVIQRIRDEGLDISDSLTLSDSNSVAKYLSTNRARGPQITINTTMQDDLNECFSKIQHHTEMRNQYRAWAQVFDAQPVVSRWKLHHDDWMFFFGK